MQSLRTRLGLGLIASLVAVFTLQWFVVTIAIREVAQHYVLTRIGHDMEALLAGLRPDTQLTLDPARIGPIYQQPFSGHYFRIESDDNTVIRSRSLWDQDLPSRRVASGAEEISEFSGPQTQHLIALTRGYTVRDRHVVISVAEDLAPLSEELRTFNRRYGLVSAAALVALLLLQGFIVGLGLRPLDGTRRELKKLETGEIDRLREDVPQEIQPLVRELNRMLAAMNERLRRSREALGNLAHALKRPLTLIAQLADDDALRSSPLRVQLLDHTSAIAALIDRELKRARLAGGRGATRRFSFTDDLPPLIDALRALYRDKTLDISYKTAGDGNYTIDREDMLELLGNLLDNACKWARSTVRISAAINNDLRLVVEDDGPGCEPAELTQLTARGVRLDESKPGHGLGLGIVRDIVAAYGGQLHFGRAAALGGLSVTVSLPAA